ncbi:MAG: LysR family transcriptional regulator [Peptococcaceae bacterium]|nr:LysR family transcriptional regulator [Peptococcaceae bacterium]
MRIEQLEHFMEIAKCHSFSQAAKNLFIGKSTLSNSISSLEKELQQDIFVRSSTGTYLSPFGEAILPSVKRILEESNNIFKLSQLELQGNNDMLFIYSYPVGAMSGVVKLFRHMNDKFPEASISIPESQSENIVRDLESSGHSVGLVSAGLLTHSYVKQHAENHNFVFEPVCEDALCVFVGKHHPLSGEKSVSIEQLVSERVVIFRLFLLPDNNAFYHDLKKLKRVYSVDNYELLKKSIESENMVAIAPHLAFYEGSELTSGRVVCLPLENCDVKLTTSLVYKKDTSQLTALEREAIRFLRDYYTSIRK